MIGVAIIGDVWIKVCEERELVFEWRSSIGGGIRHELRTWVKLGDAGSDGLLRLVEIPFG